MFYKSIKMAALAVVAVIGLAGCQNDVDIIGITDGLANNTLLGYYVHTSVDSVAMTTFKKEWKIVTDNAGKNYGYYRECTIGNCALQDQQKSLTWDSEMAEDNLSMTLTITYDDGSQEQLKWADGIIYFDNQLYAKTISGMSDIDVQLSIYKDLPGNVFEGASTKYHKHMDSIPYLAWETAVTFVFPADTAATKQQYLNDLESYKDTIIWYLREISTTHTLGLAHLDTVFVGGDTIYELVDAVTVDPIEATKPKNKGKHGITYLVSKESKREVQVNDRPEEMITGTMTFNRVNDENTATYSYRIQTWSLQYYTNPTSDSVAVSDSTYTFTASKWMVPSYANTLKFDVVMYGSSELSFTKMEAGVQKEDVHQEQDDVFHTLNITGYSKTKGEATQSGLKYKLK